MSESGTKTIFVQRQQSLERANQILKKFAPQVPLVENVGRALLVIGLHESGLSPDYQVWDECWRRACNGSSYTMGEVLPFTIAANETGAIKIVVDPNDPQTAAEIIAAIEHLWLAAPENPAQLLDDEWWLIEGVRVPPLSENQKNVVIALLEAKGRRLTERELADASGVASCRRILKELSSMPGWASILELPRRPRGGYRLRFKS